MKHKNLTLQVRHKIAQISKTLLNMQLLRINTAQEITIRHFTTGAQSSKKLKLFKNDDTEDKLQFLKTGN